MRHLVLALLVAGCGFSSVKSNPDGGIDLATQSFEDASAADAAQLPGDAQLSDDALAAADLGACGCACGAPVLLVAVQSVNGAGSLDGRVLQLALTSTGATPCGRELTAGKTLPKFPTALAWIPPDVVAYGASEGLHFIDSVKDTYRWTYKTPTYDVPRAILPLERAGGSPVVAVGYDTDGYNDIRELWIFDLALPATMRKLHQWDLTDSVNSPIYLGSFVLGMAQSPLDPMRIFYVSSGPADDPAAEVAVPYNGSKVNPTVYWDSRPPGPTFKTIRTARVGASRRTVWLQTGGLSSDPDGVYSLDDTGGGPQLTGPLRCAAALCAQPFKSSDAVPDPTAPNRVIATCSSPTSNLRHVVRFDDGGSCTLLVDGSQLPTLTYPEKLAIAPPR